MAHLSPLHWLPLDWLIHSRVHFWAIYKCPLRSLSGLVTVLGSEKMSNSATYVQVSIGRQCDTMQMSALSRIGGHIGIPSRQQGAGSHLGSLAVTSLQHAECAAAVPPLCGSEYVQGLTEDKRYALS